MTDQESSRRLALAIGYLPEHVKINDDQVLVHRQYFYKGNTLGARWVPFDLNAPDVIFPIGEHFGCFPQWHPVDLVWYVHMPDCYSSAAMAIALTVIKKHERKGKP